VKYNSKAVVGALQRLAPDGKTFSGDGGGRQTAWRATTTDNGYLFEPENRKIQAEIGLSGDTIGLEPNALFTPDGKWIIFHSNIRSDACVWQNRRIAFFIEKTSRIRKRTK